MPKSNPKLNSTKASKVRSVTKATQIQVSSKNAYAQTNKLENCICKNKNGEILVNEKNRDLRIDMLLEENMNLHKKLETLQEQIKVDYLETQQKVFTAEYNADISTARYEARQENLNDKISLLQNKLEEQQQKLYNEEKNIETMKSLLTVQTLNYLSLQKHVISKHMNKCKAMIDDLSAVLPRLSSTTIPPYDECYAQFENWKLELAKTEECLLIFNEYHKQIMNSIYTCNFLDIPHPPEIINELVEYRDVLHDNFSLAVNSLLKDLYHYQHQNQQFHQQYAQWYNSYERVNMQRAVVAAAPLRYYPIVPQNIQPSLPTDIQPSLPTYGVPRGGITVKPTTQIVTDSAAPVLSQTRNNVAASDCRANSPPNSTGNGRTSPSASSEKNRSSSASNKLEHDTKSNQTIKEPSETFEKTDLISFSQPTETESLRNLSQEPALTQNVDLLSKTDTNEYFCDSTTGSQSNDDLLGDANETQNYNEETETSEVWYAKEDTNNESEREDSDYDTAIQDKQEGNESKGSVSNFTNQSHTNAAYAENFFLVPPARFESTNDSSVKQQEVESQFLIPPAKFESVDSNSKQSTRETQFLASFAKLGKSNDSNTKQEMVENQCAANELTPISKDDEDIYAGLPEALKKSSASFCALFIFIRDSLPDIDQMEVLSVLKQVRRGMGGFSGKTRGTILNAIKEEIYLEKNKCRNFDDKPKVL
ncbi:hypothetical protein ILUMI_03342 [Ignelater luminosus]|uniref:Uncharacterized protein n=1 Tax=Ignelater luminosus TaxID=2038154 RepID=A0A8K0GMA0_IGNLU|nr:hypothetical protein ILUMI_03342 [Ignelater luminosus]